jgi:hypothetical protein
VFVSIQKKKERKEKEEHKQIEDDRHKGRRGCARELTAETKSRLYSAHDQPNQNLT